MVKDHDPWENLQAQDRWQKERVSKLQKLTHFWISATQISALPAAMERMHTDWWSAGQALRNALEDGLWRLGKDIQLAICQFILPPWFDCFFEAGFQPPWKRGADDSCVVCGRFGGARRTIGRKSVLIDEEQANYFTGWEQQGGVCSERCVLWAQCERDGDHRVPYWALQFCMVECDRYALVAAMSRRYGVRSRVHLRMGYNLTMGAAILPILPFREIVCGTNGIMSWDLREFLRTNKEFICWYDMWDLKHWVHIWVTNCSYERELVAQQNVSNWGQEGAMNQWSDAN